VPVERRFDRKYNAYSDVKMSAHVIDNCRWIFKCPLTWESLKSMGDEKVRICDVSHLVCLSIYLSDVSISIRSTCTLTTKACDEGVYYCHTIEDIQYHASLVCHHVNTFKLYVLLTLIFRDVVFLLGGSTRAITSIALEDLHPSSLSDDASVWCSIDCFIYIYS